MTTDWGQERVARVSAGGAGPPRVEIGDIRQGSGTVFTFVEDWLLISSRPQAGALLSGPFGADAAEERHLRSALELEVRDAPVHLDLTALKVISELLARRLNAKANGQVNGNGHDEAGGQVTVTVTPDRALTWDEATGDIC
jgi:hypothetical protein